MASSTRRLTTSRSGRNAYQARRAATAAIGITSFHFFISASPCFFSFFSILNLSLPSTLTAPVFPPSKLPEPSCPQDRLRRVTAFIPHQLIGRRRGETMLREELFWAQPVVFVYRAQHVTTGHAIPCHHFFLPGFLALGTRRSP